MFILNAHSMLPKLEKFSSHTETERWTEKTVTWQSSLPFETDTAETNTSTEGRWFHSWNGKPREMGSLVVNRFLFMPKRHYVKLVVDARYLNSVSVLTTINGP